jgi:hypothetical protein
MGSSGGGGYYMPVKTTQTRTRNAAGSVGSAPNVQMPTTDVVTPAVARDMSQDSNTAQQNQAIARSRLQGIRSTWASLGGSKGKLGD